MGWSYERDWLPLSKFERAGWIAFMAIEGWRVEMMREDAERKRELERAGGL